MGRTWIPSILCCWALVLPASAAQQALTPEQIEAMAEWIVDGEVTAAESRWAGDRGGALETVVWVAVGEVLLGEPVDTLAVVVAGGQVGDQGSWVPEEAHLLTDHRYRLTLVRDGRGRLRVLGGSAGAVPLDPLPCYALHGSDWAHQTHPVEEDFRINVGTFDDGMVSDERLEEAFQLALDIWSVEGGAGVYVPYGGTTSNSQYGWDNGVNVTLFDNFSWGSTLALATWNYSGNGRMTDCDIEFYGSNGGGSLNWSFDIDNGPSGGQYDFIQVATHEMGHCLGLSHSAHSGAVMYASSSPGASINARHLHSDDQAGLQAMYGLAEVELVVDARWTEVAGEDDGDGALDPGEVHEIHVALGNHGNALAADVAGTLVTDSPWLAVEPATVGLGDLPPGSNSGSDEDHLLFALSTRPGCSGEDVANLRVDADYLDGPPWQSDEWTLDVQCGVPGDDDDDDDGGDDDDDDGPRGGGLVDPGGCTCGTPSGATGAGLLSLSLVLALTRRRA